MERLKTQKSKESLISSLDSDFKLLISTRDELEKSLEGVNAKIEGYFKTQEDEPKKTYDRRRKNTNGTKQ
jgi:hypothetical protein